MPLECDTQLLAELTLFVRLLADIEDGQCRAVDVVVGIPTPEAIGRHRGERYRSDIPIRRDGAAARAHGNGGVAVDVGFPQIGIGGQRRISQRRGALGEVARERRAVRPRGDDTGKGRNAAAIVLTAEIPDQPYGEVGGRCVKQLAAYGNVVIILLADAGQDIFDKAGMVVGGDSDAARQHAV